DQFEIGKAVSDEGDCDAKRAHLKKRGLDCWALGAHLIGQLVLDPNDHRTDAWVPGELAGDPEGKRAWAIEEMKRAARAAKRFGVKVVNGFTGSPIWHFIYPFPPVTKEDI